MINFEILGPSHCGGHTRSRPLAIYSKFKFQVNGVQMM